MVEFGKNDPFGYADDQAWQACTADGARQDVLNMFSRMTFREKVAWLEEAETIACRFTLHDPRQAKGTTDRH